MFKKPYTVVSHAPLKGSAAKAWRKAVATAFPALSAAEWELLVPPKVDILLTKCSCRVWLYGVSKEEALFFDAGNGKGDLYPTVYTIW
jgi:hypothetical protein